MTGIRPLGTSPCSGPFRWHSGKTGRSRGGEGVLRVLTKASSSISLWGLGERGRQNVMLSLPCQTETVRKNICKNWIFARWLMNLLWGIRGASSLPDTALAFLSIWFTSWEVGLATTRLGAPKIWSKSTVGHTPSADRVLQPGSALRTRQSLSSFWLPWGSPGSCFLRQELAGGLQDSE